MMSPIEFYLPGTYPPTEEETEGSKEVQGLHFPHLALAFPVACYRLVTNFQETNRQQETHARSVNLRLSRNLSPFLVTSLKGGNRGNRGKKDKEDRTPVTQTPLPLWSFVWSGLRVLSTGDVTSYSISYSRGNIPCLQPQTHSRR